MVTGTDSSLEGLKRMAGNCIINNDEEYEYHLDKSIAAIGANASSSEYRYMNWFAAVGVYEVENNLPLLSNQLYDEMVSKS